ncbi:DUF2911 domain-containing protein [Nonlabens marinus]|uniref:Asparagine synthetase B n=1 Tax=Nonlabens marinus S1-08 TaxID=1454201 RepID=W8VU90_9FLAO|nr:DUF2911 domain-containing protein [Nonlabens marinus]BAO54393.1 hypothetical protein NMS_0384 [Nonlabens marinus S1-08]
MKNILLAAAAMAITFTATAQDFDKMDKSPMDAAYFPAQSTKRAFAKTEEQKAALQPQIRVLYGRPSLNDRAVFTATDEKGSGIQKFGEKWRLGANENTEIMLMSDAMIGGKELKAGRYSMVVVPTENEWTIHINSEIDAWGHYSHKEEMDVVTTTIPVTNDGESLENLSMALYSPNKDEVVHLKMGWGTYRAEMPITLL